MKRHFAKFVSGFFNPVVILLAAPYLLLRKADFPEGYIEQWTFISWACLLAFCLMMVFLVKRRVFSNLDVSNREQRPLLFLLIGVFTVIYYLLLILLHGPRILFAGTLGVMFGILLISFINTRVKASIHMAALSAFLFSLIVLNGPIYILALSLLPVVAWSRLVLHKHTRRETIIGTLSGILLMLFLYILFKYVFHLGTNV